MEEEGWDEVEIKLAQQKRQVRSSVGRRLCRSGESKHLRSLVMCADWICPTLEVFLRSPVVYMAQYIRPCILLRLSDAGERCRLNITWDHSILRIVFALIRLPFYMLFSSEQAPRIRHWDERICVAENASIDDIQAIGPISTFLLRLSSSMRPEYLMALFPMHFWLNDEHISAVGS